MPSVVVTNNERNKVSNVIVVEKSTVELHAFFSKFNVHCFSVRCG